MTGHPSRRCTCCRRYRVTKFQVSSEQDGQGIVIAESGKSSDGWRISGGEIELGESHMLTPKKGKLRGGRYDHLYNASDEAELGDSRDDSTDPRGDRDETVKDQIRRLSYDEAERDDSQYLEQRTHFSLDMVAEFEGKRYRSDASLQWLKRFIYEMKDTRMPQNPWCEPFSLSLGRAAKGWYRQLPKKTQQRWSLLSEAFLDYYFLLFDQFARTRYYSARRKENEPICDFLIRLNGYARTAKIQYEKGGVDAADHVEQLLLNCGDDGIMAKIQYEKGGVDAADHVEQLLLNCGDDGIMDLLYPLQLADIQRVEEIINKKILGEKRKKQRGCLVASRVGEARRNDGPQRRDVSRRGDIRRDHRDGRRGETHESRQDDRRSRRDESRERRVTLAVATVDDLYRGSEPLQLSRRSHSRGSSSSASAYGLSGDSGSDSDQSWNYVDAGAVSDRSAWNSDSATGVPMIAENDAVTRLSPAMVLIDIQGTGKGKVLTSSRATVKVTLGWQVVYEFEVSIMPHHAGVDLILGTDFMIPSGLRLDLYNSTARLPDEVEIPLIKSRSAWLTEPIYGDRVSDGPAESLSIPARMIAEFTLRRKQPSEDTHEFWVRRAKVWIPTVAHSSRAPTYVRLNSAKYSDWQVLAYEAAMDKGMSKREQQLYADWLARQPPAVERRPYAVPKDVMKRSPRRVDNGEAELTCAQQHELLERAAAASAESTSDRTGAAVTSTKSARDGLHKSETTESTADDSVRYEPAESAGDDPASSVQTVATSCELTNCDIAESAVAAQTDAAEWNDGPNAGAAHQSRLGVTILEAKSPGQTCEREHLSRVDSAQHETAELKEALQTARKLSAELSADSKEKSPVPEAIDSLLSDEIEVSDVALADDPEEDLRLRFVAAMAMCEDESITVVDNSATDPAEFECSANEIDLEDYAHELAFLPDLTDAASTVLDYGGANVVCSAHTPSQQEKLVKALKAQEGIMIASGNALPPAYGAICDIDLPVVLLARRDQRVLGGHDDSAREISAFVCALGHFEWLRMPFGLKNAPMIYQNIIDNALWGYVQPRGGWASYAEKVRRAEAASATQRRRLSDPNQPTPDSVNSATELEADHRALAESEPLQDLVNSPESDMFANGEPDESTLTPVFDRRSFVDDIFFGGTTFEDCLATLRRLLARFAECRISISFTMSIFVQPAVDFLSHEVSQHGIRANPAKLAAIAELPFPTSKKGMQRFLGALNYYSRFIQNMAVNGAVLYQLKDADFADGGDLAAAKLAFAEFKTKVANAPILRHFDSAREVHIMLFANAWALSSTLLQPHDGLLHPVRLCGRVLKENEVNDHPAEKEVLALLHILKVGHTLFAGKTLHVYTRFSTLEWVFTSKSLYGRAVSFAVLRSPYHLKVK
ncbi:unnamed protein product [Phytophthora fragariaefolia]|uniref:Unnamed protein product n=1 Tax=Phytophthora fragariaefolia TaxID=1490495 RepID=A0A9W6XWT7_9STRA|nr:unnamed protein product [Phytophthora fragariaefolia]